MKMKIADERKFDVLMAQLDERYAALHKMRDRSMNFTLWILGLGLGMAWLLISEVALNKTQSFLIAAFLAAISLASFFFLKAIHRGFDHNRAITIRLETMLKLYEDDFYDSSGSVLPKEFSSKKPGWSGHFATLYCLLAIVFVCLIILTFLNPCRHQGLSDSNPSSVPITEKQVQQR